MNPGICLVAQKKPLIIFIFPFLKLRYGNEGGYQSVTLFNNYCIALGKIVDPLS